MTDQPIRDYLGDMVVDVEDGVMITDIILIGKTYRLDTETVGLFVASTVGLSWIEQLGMIKAAERIETADIVPNDDLE